MRRGCTYHSRVGSASNLDQSFVCKCITACLWIDNSGFAESKESHYPSCRRMPTVLRDFCFHGQASKDRHHPRLFYLDDLSWQCPLDTEVDQGRMTACWFQEREDLHIVASIGTIVGSEGSRPGNLHTQQQSCCREQSGNGPWQVQPQHHMVRPLSSSDLSGPCHFPGDRSLLLPDGRGLRSLGNFLGSLGSILLPPLGAAPVLAPPLLGGPN